MKPIIIKRSQFKLKGFLAALHQFSLDHCGNGEPLPGASGDTVYHDTGDLAEALAQDEGFEVIPDDSLARLELGLPLFGPRLVQRLRRVRLRGRPGGRSAGTR